MPRRGTPVAAGHLLIDDGGGVGFGGSEVVAAENMGTDGGEVLGTGATARDADRIGESGDSELPWSTTVAAEGSVLHYGHPANAG